MSNPVGPAAWGGGPWIAVVRRAAALAAMIEEEDPVRTTELSQEALNHLDAVRDWLIQERLQGVARLRDAGMSIGSIADALGISKSRAHQLVTAVDSTTPRSGGPTGVPPLLTTVEAAAFLRVGVRTMRRWRTDGGGPPYVQAGGRRILYDRRQLEAWLKSQTPPWGRCLAREPMTLSAPLLVRTEENVDHRAAPPLARVLTVRGIDGRTVGGSPRPTRLARLSVRLPHLSIG